jgi:hypothetical protein
MPYTKLFSEITIGGDHSDNPANYNWRTYENYPGIDPTQTYLRIDVIIFDDETHQDLQVTGLAFMIGGHPQTGPNDVCIAPCPPFC